MRTAEEFQPAQLCLVSSREPLHPPRKIAPPRQRPLRTRRYHDRLVSQSPKHALPHAPVGHTPWKPHSHEPVNGYCLGRTSVQRPETTTAGLKLLTPVLLGCVPLIHTSSHTVEFGPHTPTSAWRLVGGSPNRSAMPFEQDR